MGKPPDQMTHESIARASLGGTVPRAPNLLEHILNSAPQAIFWKDCRGVYLGCNRVFARMIGLKQPEDIIGKTDYDLPWPKEQAEAYRADDQEVIQTNRSKPHTIEPFQQADGSSRWVETTKFPLADEEGRVYGVLGVFEDITKRKRDEEALRETNDRLSMAMDVGDAGVWEWSLNRDEVRLDDRFHMMLGYTPGELPNTLPEWLSYHHPEDAPAWMSRAKAYLRGDCPVYESEYRIRNKAGTWSWVFTRGKLVNNATTGSPELFIGIAINITARKRAEEALRESERELKEAQRLARIGSWDWDILTDTITWSDEYYHIYDFDPTRSPPGYEEHLKAYAPESAARLDAAVKNSMETGEPYEVDLEQARRDGARRWVTARCEIIRDTNNRIVGLRGTAQDITERKQAEEELQFRNVLLATQQETSIDGILVVDENNLIISYNRRFIELWGLPAKLVEDRVDEPVLQFVTAQMADPQSFLQRVQYLYEHRQETSRDELALADGRFFDRYSAPMIGSDKRYFGRVWYFRDITERKRAEKELHRLNRELRAISSCNQVLVHAEDEQTLLNDICHIICDEAGYLLAWVGYVEYDDQKTVRPMAWGGFDDGYVANAKLSWADDAERAQGPGGAAIRSGKTVYIQDFTTDPRIAPWRENALQRGYRSMIALPLKDENANVFGVLLIYSTEISSFTPYEIRILEELASDMAFGIVVLRDRTERKRAEQERLAHLRLLESLDRVNRAIHGTNDIGRMMNDALETVFSIFDCDRTWLFYPCDPDAPSFRVPMEIAKPEYPGAKVLNVDIPMPPDMAQNLREALESAGPVTYTVGTERPVNKVSAEQFGVQSQMFAALYPKLGRPWVFGMHQCSYPRVWTREEKTLFQEIGRRLGDGLTSVLMLRDLQRSEEFVNSIVENIPDMIFVKDVEALRFVRFNKAGEQLLGYSREELVGKSDSDFFPKEEADSFTAKDREVLSQKGVVDIPEETIRTRDGNERIIHTKKIPIMDNEGNPQYLLGISEDITERKRVELELRQSERGKGIQNRIASIFLSASDTEMYGDVLAIVLEITESPLGLFGYIADNGDLVIPSMTREIWDECAVPGKSMVFPPSAWGETLWGRALRERKAFYSSGPLRTPMSHVIVDHFLTVPIVFGAQSIGLLSVANKDGGYTEGDKGPLESIASYISPILHARLQRDREERVRRQSEAKFATAFNASPDLVSITRLGDGAILEVNEGYTRLLGYTRGESLGKPTAELSIWADLADRGRFTAALQKSGEVNDFETTLRRKDGTLVAVIDSARTFDLQGEACVLSVVHDITNRKRAEAVREATYQIARAASASKNLAELLEAVHLIIQGTMPARNLYIALYDEQEGLIQFPYFADEKDSSPPPMPMGSGLTAYVLNTRKPLLADAARLDTLKREGVAVPAGSPAAIWLGVPLMLEGRAIGVLAVQHYSDPAAFSESDQQILEFVASEVARAIAQKRAEEEVQRLNRLYTVLSRTNEMIIRVQGPQELFDDACRIAVEQGLFKMAWVGVVDEKTHEVKLVSSYGETSTYLQTARFSVDDVPEGHGPTGTALREGRHVICRDIEHEPFMAPWRDAALAMGFRSSAAFPLRTGDAVTGVYTVYSPEVGWFSEGEVRLLDELTADMSYALGSMQKEELRKQAEEQLHLLGTAIEQASEVIVITDRDGAILYANPAFEEISGYSRWEAVGQNPRILKSGCHDEAFYRNLWETILAGNVWSGRLVNKRKDGRLYTEQAVISPVRDASGAIISFVAVKRDITVELELQQKLNAAKDLQTIGMIAGGVAHEVRNPLFAISTVVAALVKRLAGQTEFREYADHIQDQTRRLNELMSDLLTLGRPLKSEQFQSCSLQDIVREAIRLMEDTVPAADHRCVVSSSNGTSAIRAVPEKLTQVIVNLLQNAFAFSPPDATVSVRIEQTAGQVCLRIQDSGSGIPSDLLPAIFEPFQSKRKGGTGLGLAIVRQIVRAHGGTVEAANNDPPPGATFTVSLPLEPA